MPSPKAAKDQLVVGKRIYSDLQANERQSVLSYLVAVTTLALYVGYVALGAMEALLWLPVKCPPLTPIERGLGTGLLHMFG
jgi:uncharacterized membrane protein (DUF485 family)